MADSEASQGPLFLMKVLWRLNAICCKSLKEATIDEDFYTLMEVSPEPHSFE